MFMSFENIIYKYKILKKDKNSSTDYTTQEGQIIHKNSKSIYYFESDSSYNLEIK